MSKRTYSKVSIKPYFQPGVPNMGLERYKQVLFDGITHSYEIAAVDEAGAIRYITGLNPFAPEVVRLPAEERKAREAQIKDMILEMESRLGGNVINPKDAEWWNKVKKVRPDNIDFWSDDTMRIKPTNDGLILDVQRSAIDFLKYTAIKSKGVPEIAVSLEDARSRVKPPMFYLDELEETASIETELLKLRDTAGALLKELYDTNVNKLLYVCKVVDGNSAQYKKSTPNDIMYLNMSKYISGETVDTDKRKTARTFIEVAGSDMATLKLRALIKDASFYKYIAPKGDNMIYEMESGIPLGKTPSHVLEYLKNPLNDEVTSRLLDKVEPYWNQ